MLVHITSSPRSGSNLYFITSKVMAKTRQVKVKLNEIDGVATDPLWTDSFVLVEVLPFGEVKELNKTFRKIQKDSNKLTREIKKLNFRIEELDKEGRFEESDPLVIEKEKLEDKLESVNLQQIDLSNELINKYLLSGSVYDKEEKKEVSITSENIHKYLDTALIGKIVEFITGSLGKKA